MKNMKRIITISLLIFYLIGVFTFIHFEKEEKNNHEIMNVELLKAQRKEVFDSLVWIVNDEIKHSFPKSKINRWLLVKHSLVENVDLTLVLSQARLESQYGTLVKKGEVADYSNSVFGVIKDYQTIDDSIYPYVRLISTRYLNNNRTVDDLLESGFKQTNTSRKYAADPLYCQKLKRIRTHLQKTYNIEELQEKYNELTTKINDIK